MKLYKNTNLQLFFLYALFFAVSISEYKFLYSSTIPVFIFGLIGLFFFYKNLKFTIDEILIYSFFGIYLSVYLFFFNDLLVYFKSFKYHFGWIFFLFLFKSLTVNISLKNCFYFLFFLFLIEFVLINFLKINYSSLYPGIFPSFRFYDEFFRINGFTGNASITISIFSALYLSIILNNKIKILEFAVYLVVTILSYSTLGFIFLLINIFILSYKLKLFNFLNVVFLSNFLMIIFLLSLSNLDISVGNKYRPGPLKYFKELKDYKIYQIKKDIGAMLSEDKEFSQVNNFFYNTFKVGSEYDQNSLYVAFILDENNQSSLVDEIYFIDNLNTGYQDLLFGLQKKTNIFFTGGDFAILSQISSLGIFSLLIMYVFLKYYKIHLNLPAIILVLSCIHYPTLMHISGQFFLAVLLNNNKLIQRYD
tara:strand:+ start:936 stop:2195 length:1260 start_codon:yes stop_codon:yes gene_type:complete